MAKTKAQTSEAPEVVQVENPDVDNAVDESEATERFIMRRLRVINNMTDAAKAKRLAERILMNRKG